MSGTVYVRCDDGSVIEHDLPLPSGIADRVARGQLKLVNADGSDPADEPTGQDTEPPAKPARRRTK